jgi:LCP family protein required for cell wall assembly
MAAGTGPRRRRAGLSTHKTSFSWDRHRRLLALLVVVGFLVSGMSGVVAYFLPAVTAAFQITGQGPSDKGGKSTLPTADPTSTPALASGSPFTVLLLGSDNDTKYAPGHVLTQTMILVRVDPSTHQAVMLSIPRDLWVPIASGGTAKIDAAYLDGGSADAVQTVENNFDVPVNYWVWIGLGGLVSIVNQLHGVNIVGQMPILDDQYPADLTGSNPYDNQRIAILPGPQRVNGVNALTYVRSRHGDILEDIARSQKQQQLLVDIKSAASILGLADIPRIAGSLGDEIHTSMSLAHIGSIAALAKAYSDGNVKQIVMLGTDYQSVIEPDGEDALAPNWTAINALVAQNFPK